MGEKQKCIIIKKNNLEEKFKNIIRSLLLNEFGYFIFFSTKVNIKIFFYFLIKYKLFFD